MKIDTANLAERIANAWREGREHSAQNMLDAALAAFRADGIAAARDAVKTDGAVLALVEAAEAAYALISQSRGEHEPIARSLNAALARFEVSDATDTASTRDGDGMRG